MEATLGIEAAGPGDSLNRDMDLKMKGLVTTNQMDPQEVVQHMVELVEAETTTENNFVPANIIEMLTQQVG